MPKAVVFDPMAVGAQGLQITWIVVFVIPIHVVHIELDSVLWNKSAPFACCTFSASVTAGPTCSIGFPFAGAA